MPHSQIIQKSRLQWKQVEKALHSRFHFDGLRPGQEEVIRSILDGKNTLAIMPTGSGKSLCYQLPALQLRGTTIVVSPLISLMKDQHEKVEEKGIAAVELNSTIGAAETRAGMDRISNAEAELLYVTPERFSRSEFVEQMQKMNINFVVIDEAHCVSQWGHDFRPAYLGIGETLRHIGQPPLLALTATASEEVVDDIQKQLGLKELAVFRSSVLRENLNFEAQYLNTPSEKMQAVLALVREMQDSSGIIYTATVQAAKQVHEFLKDQGVGSILYHGKLKAREREAHQNEFMNHTPRLMIATNAFGMGIDKADIRYVIHFQFPASLDAYYQEAGRAGRDGAKARCILLYLKRDKCTQSLFLSGKYPRAEEVAQVYSTLQDFARKNLSANRETLGSHLPPHFSQKKVSVILSLLKQTKILKEIKRTGFKLLKADLVPSAVDALAQVYAARAERDRTKLNDVIIYAQTALCRWQNILRYFNEESALETCGHCDNCLVPGRQHLRSESEELAKLVPA